jgi:hypothetical protein
VTLTTTNDRPAVRERPIIFSAWSVRRILDGAKSVTRRLVKPQPPSAEEVRKRCGVGFDLAYEPAMREAVVYGPVSAVRDVMGREPVWPCGFPVGARLWVREEWRITGGGGWWGVAYRADEDARGAFRDAYRSLGLDSLGRKAVGQDDWERVMRTGTACCEWRPALFMPKWASRLTLEVTAVRVEPLREITPEDVWAEGLPRGIYRHATKGFHPCDDGDEAQVPDGRVFKPVYAFGELWESIHGPGAWERDREKWVWCVTFRRVGPSPAAEGGRHA